MRIIQNLVSALLAQERKGASRPISLRELQAGQEVQGLVTGKDGLLDLIDLGGQTVRAKSENRLPQGAQVRLRVLQTGTPLKVKLLEVKEGSIQDDSGARSYLNLKVSGLKAERALALLKNLPLKSPPLSPSSLSKTDAIKRLGELKEILQGLSVDEIPSSQKIRALFLALAPSKAAASPPLQALVKQALELLSGMESADEQVVSSKALTSTPDDNSRFNPTPDVSANKEVVSPDRGTHWNTPLANGTKQIFSGTKTADQVYKGINQGGRPCFQAADNPDAAPRQTGGHTLSTVHQARDPEYTARGHSLESDLPFGSASKEGCKGEAGKGLAKDFFLSLESAGKIGKSGAITADETTEIKFHTQTGPRAHAEEGLGRWDPENFQPRQKTNMSAPGRDAQVDHKTQRASYPHPPSPTEKGQAEPGSVSSEASGTYKKATGSQGVADPARGNGFPWETRGDAGKQDLKDIKIQETWEQIEVQKANRFLAQRLPQVLDGLKALASYLDSVQQYHSQFSQNDIPFLLIPVWFKQNEGNGNLAWWKEEGTVDLGGLHQAQHLFFDLDLKALGPVKVHIVSQAKALLVTVWAREKVLNHFRACMESLSSSLGSLGFRVQSIDLLPLETVAPEAAGPSVSQNGMNPKGGFYKVT